MDEQLYFLSMSGFYGVTFVSHGQSLYTCCLGSMFLSFLDFIYLFLERGEGRERGEKH